MPINLTKGQKVDLTKGNPGLKKLMVGLGWDVNAFDSGADFDLDASAFMLGDNGKCPTEKEFIFYGNLAHDSESVQHMGDNLTGEGEGDDEQIFVELSTLPEQYDKIVFVVNIYQAAQRRQIGGRGNDQYRNYRCGAHRKGTSAVHHLSCEKRLCEGGGGSFHE